MLGRKASGSHTGRREAGQGEEMETGSSYGGQGRRIQDDWIRTVHHILKQRDMKEVEENDFNVKSEGPLQGKQVLLTTELFLVPKDLSLLHLNTLQVLRAFPSNGIF